MYIITNSSLCCFVIPVVSAITGLFTNKDTSNQKLLVAHTHTHTQRERERERERGIKTHMHTHIHKYVRTYIHTYVRTYTRIMNKNKVITITV